MGNRQVRENYIIKDEEADFYNMRGRGPFMVDSFGRKYLKPSVSHFPLYNMYPNMYPNMFYHRRGYYGHPRYYPLSETYLNLPFSDIVKYYTHSVL